MCGIVGYTGCNCGTQILLDGLKRLEYRGYDSAGIALAGKKGLMAVKSVGKVKCLEAACRQAWGDFAVMPGSAGIAHTRSETA